MTTLRVAIFQDYLPQYRVSFFSGLVDRLSRDDIECVVVAGQPTGSQITRGDDSKRTSWLRYANPREFVVGRGGPRFFGFGTDRNWRDCDGLVMPLCGTSLDLTMELLRKRSSRRRLGVWGHVKPYTQPGNSVDLAIERCQMRHSDHVFAYTESGAEFAAAAGVESEKITSVMNTTDVSELLTAYNSIATADVGELQDRHRLTPGKTFGLIGGLDAPKRIDFLALVLDQLWAQDPTVKLLVGGRGDQEHLLASAVERGQVVTLGYVGAREKALLLRAAECLINPGRIGLLAVECMAVGIPLLTTEWKFHAPEYEYLQPGDDVLISPDDADAFADLILSCTNEQGRVRQHTGKHYPSIDDMIRNFANGVQEMFA
jgi:glycosyltransferase involved in cell wall biosynthesis